MMGQLMHRYKVQCSGVCVCVCARTCTCTPMCGDHIRDLAGLQVQVTVMTTYGIISLGKKLTHNCLSRLGSINEYLIIDWGGKGLRL